LAQDTRPKPFKRFAFSCAEKSRAQSPGVKSGTGVAEFPVMADPVEPKPDEIDPDNLSRLLELELIQKRAIWKQAGERYRSIRAAGFVFLFVLIVGCLIGGYFAFMRVNEQRANPPPNSAVDR
jgi:hypothetical protein